MGGPAEDVVGEDEEIMTRRRWTEDDIRRLEDGYDSGRRIDTIAEELGRTRSAIVDRAHRLGVSTDRPRYTATEERLMLQWREQKRSIADIAAELGTTRGAVSMKLYRMRRALREKGA